MSERYDQRDADWPERPWIMAAICAAAGFLFDLLADLNSEAVASTVRQAAATFVAIAAISFVMTVEQRRWQWSLGFALGWGLVVAMVGWFTATYNHQPEIFEFPFLSGIFAVLLAAPLFQTVRDEGAWRFPYARLHGHAWTDVVIGAASLAFVGVTFLMSWLIALLFGLIGIDLVQDLLEESWFAWSLAGFAFGSAVGLMRERDALVATLQRLVMVVLGVLAPVLAAALALFLLSVPFTGLGELWDGAIPATPLMLLAGAGAVLLANAVIGNGRDDRTTSRVLRISAMVLVVAVLPLAIIAAISIGQRIGQYGWTPERIWGVVAAAVAIAYGIAGWWAVARGRTDFDDRLRPLQTQLAVGLCGLALFLALPIVDFGAISARSQMARFTAGKVEANEFDWKAMAFDFGPAGRKRLAEVARLGPPEQRRLAAAALASEYRYDVEEEVAAADSGTSLDRRMRVLPEGTVLPDALRQEVAATRQCRLDDCIVMMVDADSAVIAGASYERGPLHPVIARLQADGSWSVNRAPEVAPAVPATPPDLKTAPVELRTVERHQLYVDGKPVGDAFE